MCVCLIFSISERDVVVFLCLSFVYRVGPKLARMSHKPILICFWALSANASSASHHDLHR